MGMITYHQLALLSRWLSELLQVRYVGYVCFVGYVSSPNPFFSSWKFHHFVCVRVSLTSSVVSWGPRPKFQQTELHMLPWHFLDTPVVGPPNTKEWKSGLLLVTKKNWSPLAWIKILVPSISLIIFNGYSIFIIQKVYCGYRYMTEREGEILFFWKHETVPTRNFLICYLWFLFDFSIGKHFLTRINCSDLKTCSNGRSPILEINHT